jgi:DNA-binding transcriptional MerR regulator
VKGSREDLVMKFETFKVGNLARRTGLTVRALHHDDAIGLVRPSGHTDAGHRLYTGRDVARLQQALSPRQLGFSLDEIRECLSRPGFSPFEVVRLHIARLREQIERQQNLYSRLGTIAGWRVREQRPSGIRVIPAFEKHTSRRRRSPAPGSI